jgi:hypothetical protein
MICCIHVGLKEEWKGEGERGGVDSEKGEELV